MFSVQRTIESSVNFTKNIEHLNEYIPTGINEYS